MAIPFSLVREKQLVFYIPYEMVSSALLLSHFLNLIHIHRLPCVPVQRNLLYSRCLLFLLVVLYEDAELADVCKLHKPVLDSQQHSEHCTRPPAAQPQVTPAGVHATGEQGFAEWRMHGTCGFQVLCAVVSCIEPSSMHAGVLHSFCCMAPGIHYAGSVEAKLTLAAGASPPGLLLTAQIPAMLGSLRPQRSLAMACL
jgi:hypothetical protein